MFGRRSGTNDLHAQFDKRLVLQVAAKRMPSLGQLKHLPLFLSGGEKKVVRNLSAILLIALAIFGYRYGKAHITSSPAQGGDYVEAVVGGPRLINPALAASNDIDRDLVTLIFSGLMRTAEDGSLITDLATSYTISDDGKVYTFKLREGVLWHDGTAFSSADVAATIAYIKNPAWNSPFASRYKNVTVETPDDKTVVFTLGEPFAPFLSMLTVRIMPQHLWQDILPENAGRTDLDLKPVGTGPFKFKSFARDTKGAIITYTLARNPDYYAEKPRLATVTFRNYPDFTSAHEALAARKVDGISYLPLEMREEAAKQNDLRFYTLRLPQYTAIFFNQKKNPALLAKNVRQALAYAIDRPAALRNSIGSNGVVVHAPILSGFVGFNPDVKKYDLDGAKSAELLDGEGWKIDVADGLRKKNIVGADKKTTLQTLHVTLTTADSKENSDVAESVKKDWEKLGVQVELEVIPTTRIQKDIVRTRGYEALLFGEIVGADPDPYPFWHSSQSDNGLNLAMFSNRRADELLEKARATTKTDDRTNFYREFQDILAEEEPAIMLYSPAYTYALNRRVKGVEPGTIFEPSDRFDGISRWYIDTKLEWK